MHACILVDLWIELRKTEGAKKKEKKTSAESSGYELNGGANKDSIKLLKAAALF